MGRRRPDRLAQMLQLQQQGEERMGLLDNLPRPTSGGFARFMTPGDTVEGHLIEVSDRGTTIDGKPCPLLVVDTDDGVTNVTCSQTDLLRQVIDLDVKGAFAGLPKRIRIAFDKVEPRPGGKTMKRFAIKLGDAAKGYVAPTGDADDAEAPF